jgi:hypothetical protein
MVFALTASAALLAGCGGGGGGASSSTGATTASSSTSSATITKPEFIAKGDAICEETDARQAAHYKVYVKENGEDTSKAGQEKNVTEIGLPAIRVEIKELRDLGIPAGDEEAVEAILKGSEAAIAKAQAKPALVLELGTDPFNEVERLAPSYGFKSCGIQ